MRVVVFILVAGCTGQVWGFGTGAGTCDVVADFSTITAMGSRNRNQHTGPFTLVADTAFYNSTDFVEITLSGAPFTGIVISVVDENGSKVGTFDFNSETQVQECDGNAMAVTHTSTHGSVSNRSMFWIPPAEPVGTVYVLAYVLSGQRGDQGSQQFYRFVRDDLSAVVIQSEVIFAAGFD
ncbi:Reeler domain-containing protein [Marinicella sediminis]|uniref:Reeler domain-containing protein n=1 Tax=Marinicella sediminis TaxID=1792834 RepID=A0ABV7J6N1_9GAMM|nr:Reeler domain-containing protein [Marinicella sediminis]